MDCGLDRQCTIGDNLCNLVCTILLGEVGDADVSVSLADVGIDIRHADTLRVEKSLEIQVEQHWVAVVDTQQIAHE